MKQMNHSLRFKMTILLISFTMLTIGACWLLNSMFLGTYYISKKKPVLTGLYEVLNSMNYVKTEGFYNGLLSQSDVLYLQQLCEKNGISLLVADSSFNMIFRHGIASEKMQSRMMEILFSSSQDNETVLEKNDNCRLVTVKDTQLNMNYLEMSGVLNSGNMFVMRIALENIQESVMVSNRLMGYIGTGMLLFCSVLMLIITKSFTQPILELADLSRQMSHLNFSAKYTGNRDDEIGILGKNMNHLSEELEQTISRLKQANLELQRDIAKKEQIDEMRKEFLSNVSHELKTPIALIQGYAEGLLEDFTQDQESRDFYCSVIIDEANKMNKLVKNLLNLNQIEFGNQGVSMERFDIIALISGVLNASDILMEQKEAKIYFDDSKEYYVWSDEFQIEQVLTNYVSNALNHLGGEREIYIDVLERGDKIRVSVMNTGQLIPLEDIDKIWQKFYKVDKARTREYGGSGIGLSIVKAIMENLHQQYGVENKENGVLFWFEVEREQAGAV